MSRGTEREGRFDHLFSEPIRDRIDDAGYGSWRSYDAPDAVSLSYGFPFPDSFPNDELVAAASALFDAEGDRALQYGGGEYADALTDAVLDRAARRGIDADGSQVLVTNGATHAIDVVSQTFLDPGDAMVVEAPTFMGALTVFRNYGPEIVGCPIRETGLDVDALAETLADRERRGEPAPTLVYTIPTFQNPTGTTLPRADRERLLDLAAEHDFVILEDDAYGDLRFDGDPVAPLAALDDAGRVVHVGTFSKTIAPGVRTGWAIAHEEVAERLQGSAAGGENTFTRGVLGRYCAEGHLDENVPRLRRAYEHRRDRMLDALASEMPAGTDWTEPDGGFFVWLTLPDGIDAAALLERAAEEGVTYLPGTLFYPDGGGEDQARLSFSHASPAELREAIAALGRATRAALDGEA